MGGTSNQLEVQVTVDQAPDSPFMENKIKDDLENLEKEDIEEILTNDEKRYLLFVERGDVASVRHIMKKGVKENERRANSFNINCKDPLGRTSLNIAIENENLDMIKMLLDENVAPGDSLLMAISEEYVEGVEVLLTHEERIHKFGEAYSWEKFATDRTTYTPDITPLILAAHRNNYEILKMLLDRGASLPMPHDIKCACDECITANAEDSLRYSHSRINAYRALASPSLICLSSSDPFLTAFVLSDDLKKLSTMEKEFVKDYLALRRQVQNFTMDLVDETRTSTELEIILNYDPEGEPYISGQFMHLCRLREAVDNKQKEFVAHSNVQQLLSRVWYDGMPGFKRLDFPRQMIQMAKIGCLFPVYCLALLFAPNSSYGAAMKKPFIKFIIHSTAYCFFLLLLVVASLNVEKTLIELFGSEWMLARLKEAERASRGGFPSIVELVIVIFILGFIKNEIMTLWEDGILVYIKDLWNIIDFCTNFFYMNWVLLRLTAWFLTQRAVWSGQDPFYPREMWPPYDPMLIAEGMFGAANILSFLKLVHIFSVSPYMGPLQIALGRMVIDIMKFFVIYTLVLFAFGCGLNQLLWYYADLEMRKCYSLPGGLPNPDEERACGIWRSFSNLFETSQSLFWASFGLVNLNVFDLTGIKSFTRFWSMLMFGSYNVINVIVLLNLLIAMMSNSYALICQQCDMEWKFARSKLWMSFFEEGNDLPSPFNLLPNLSSLCKEKEKVSRASFKKRQNSLRDNQYLNVMQSLVKRYVTKEQRRIDERSVKEDDINEVKQDISSFKYEILNILRINSWNTGTAHEKQEWAFGKKQQTRERQLLKGFNIAPVEGVDISSLAEKIMATSLTVIAAFMSAKKKKDWDSEVRMRHDHIGSSHTNKRRVSLREKSRQSCGTKWKTVQFYQKRGVFLGGENINSVMLQEARKAKPIEKKSQSQPRYGRGWVRLQQLHALGQVTTDASTEPLPSEPSTSQN